MRLSAKVAYNTLVQIISKVVATALGLVAVAVITRYLGRSGFGQYTTVLTFLSFFGIIADLGLTLVTVQMISRPGIDRDRILGNLFGLRLVSAFIFLGCAPIIVLFFPYGPAIRTGVAVAALSFLFIALNQILVGLFQKELRMDRVSVAEVAGRVVLVLGVFAAISLGAGLYGILAATVAASAVNFGLHYLFSRSLARIAPRFDLAVWRGIAGRSWPLALTIVFNLVYLKTDTLLLSIIKRPSDIGIIAEVGLYGAAYKVIDVLITFPFMFAGIILPILTACWTRDDKSGFKDVLQRSFDVLAIVAVPLVVGAQFTAGSIMVFVAGSEFANSGPILQILILAAAMIFLGNIPAHAVIAIEKQKKIISAYAFTALTALIGYFIFIPRYSYFGAAWVTIYSEAAIALASIYIVWKYTRFLPSLNITIRALAASGIMAVGLYAVPVSNLAVILPLAVTTYLAALYLFRGITWEELREVFPNK